MSSSTVVQQRYSAVVPHIHPDVVGKQFYLDGFDAYARYIEEHPDAISNLGLNSIQTRGILNFINGQRSVTEIRNRVAALAGDDLTIEQVVGYLRILEEVGWIVVDGDL